MNKNTTFNQGTSDSIKGDYNEKPVNVTQTQQDVIYTFPTRKEVTCVVIDKIDWARMKTNINDLSIKLSPIDASSLLFGFSITLTFEGLTALSAATADTNTKAILYKLLLAIIFLIAGLAVKKFNKASHPEALNEKLSNIKAIVTDIEKKIT